MIYLNLSKKKKILIKKLLKSTTFNQQTNWKRWKKNLISGIANTGNTAVQAIENNDNVNKVIQQQEKK